MEEVEGLTTQPEASIRDTVLDSISSVTESAPPEVNPTESPKEASEAVADTPEQKLGRTANRLRDEAGRLLPGTKEPKAADPKAADPKAAPAAPAEPAAPAAPQIKRPSTWKKDHWEAFDKLATENPKLAEYLIQRENEYAKGVSTYKNEFDRLRPLDEVVAPYRQVMQQYNMQEADVVKNLLATHHTLSLGTPDQRIDIVSKVIDDYKMPVKLAYQDQQGNWQLLAPRQQPQQAQQPQPQNIDAIVEQKLAQREIMTALQQFERDVPEKYPHYETVKPTMIGLLQAGLATDYPSAYEAAIRHPQHADIFEALQQQQAEQKAAEAAAANQQRINRARANNVSVRTASPAGSAPVGGSSIRDVLTEAVRQHASGRV